MSADVPNCLTTCCGIVQPLRGASAILVLMIQLFQDVLRPGEGILDAVFPKPKSAAALVRAHAHASPTSGESVSQTPATRPAERIQWVNPNIYPV